jgi:hypothetical protein
MIELNAAESRFLTGRSRRISADRVLVKRETAEGARLATSRGHGAQPISLSREGSGT